MPVLQCYLVQKFLHVVVFGRAICKLHAEDGIAKKRASRRGNVEILHFFSTLLTILSVSLLGDFYHPKTEFLFYTLKEFFKFVMVFRLAYSFFFQLFSLNLRIWPR